MLNFYVSDENKKKIGEIIKEKRLEKNLSTSEFAEETTLEEGYIKLFEEGNIYITNPLILKKMADVLGLDYLGLYYIAGFIDENGIYNFFKKSSKIYNLIQKIYFSDIEEILKVNDYQRFVKGIKDRK